MNCTRRHTSTMKLDTHISKEYFLPSAVETSVSPGGCSRTIVGVFLEREG